MEEEKRKGKAVARRKKSGKKYVLYGCPVDESARYDVEGYVGKLAEGGIGLVEDAGGAIVYVDDKEPGHGTPADWIKLLREDYGLNVRPRYLKG